MAGPPWRLHEDVKLAIMYVGGVPWERIGYYFENRSIPSLRQRITKLNIPRNRAAPVFSRGVDPKDWEIWKLRQKGYNKRKIAEVVGVDFSTLQARMSSRGLYYGPPTGDPPEGVGV